MTVVCEATLRPVGTEARGALCLGFFSLWKSPDLLLLGLEDSSRCLCCVSLGLDMRASA